MVLFVRPWDGAYYLDLATEQTGIQPSAFCCEKYIF